MEDEALGIGYAVELGAVVEGDDPVCAIRRCASYGVVTLGEENALLVVRTRLTRLHSEEEMLGNQRLSNTRHREFMEASEELTLEPLAPLVRQHAHQARV